ncbi:chemotaxis protein CheC [Liquorilactobacillus hordei]|uniref:Chemotaxis protein CheC n=2 Tax=Liquorilactobacillus hordei TaxID=468911 RepID=A0A0A7RFQ8_9LACO|nr:chemotaxis protein CheC [Liquorilactobacillus hordei]AJA34030.1 chemotaxis protein CheC [Liquorilactobacillus hordei]KRL06042.1 chemotaxis protein CheC [Liquorilactobacillus hordei DSM 19519]QYH51323.1 chemotaxis protein CheC [Liquorilactobacillus hordei DSM 19519]
MEYTDIELDAIREIINIGGGNAATSISKLVNQKINMHVPEISFLSYHELYKEIYTEDEEVQATISNFNGDYSGVFLLVIPDKSIKKLVKLLLGEDSASDELEISAISELTNIVTNSFLSAIEGLLNAEIQTSVPRTQEDYFGAIISSSYLALEHYDDQIMIMRNEFIYADEKIDSSLFLIPEQGVLNKMVESLRI